MMENKLLFGLRVFALLCFSNITFGQAPDLGITSDFAVFTATGAFGNTGATNITGNIGTNAGALTGFPPGVVTGQIHVVDSVTLQAATDAAIAYSYLDNMTCDTVIGTTFGNNQVLAPKVYCVGALATLNGNLILDGQGNPNALFFFKINGAFSTTSLSTITLIDSAVWSNVYWQINGAVSLGDSSVFAGTILASGAISLLEGASLIGRTISIAGAISLQNNIISIGAQAQNVLPIELLSFSASGVGEDVQLNWATAGETNNNYFTVEHSKDGIYFEKVLQVKGAKNSNTILYYSAIDDKPYTGISYYRLKQTDMNGKFVDENVLEVDYGKSIHVNIYPNPFSSTITMMMQDTLQIPFCTLCIYNAIGEEVMNTIINKQLTVFETGNLPSGIYFYNMLNHTNQVIQSGKLVSQQ
jgi:hypothetical protein